MNLVYKCSMFPFPTVFTLEDTKIHIGSIDFSYVTSNIEASSIYQHFHIQATLGVLNVNSYDYYVWFGWCFNDIQFGGKHNVIEYICQFDNALDDIRENWEVSILNKIRNAKNFQIWFQLEEM